MYKAVKYIRLSYTEDKSVESDSVSNQRKLIDDYIKTHPDIKAVAEKVDDGISGAIFDRKAFKEMIELINEGKANCIIVKDLSRFGREYIETLGYLRFFFPNNGVRFIAINSKIDTLKDSADDLSIIIRSLVDDDYCRDISVKTRTALDVKRRNGDFVGASVIYGYLKDKNNHNQLIIDDYASKIVQEIFRKFLSGYSAATIANELNSLGILSPSEYKKERGIKSGFSSQNDCKWSATTIIRILNNENYTGTLVQGKTTTPNFKIKKREIKPENEWIKVKNAHKAIISKHDFELVQRLRSLDTRTSPNKNIVYMFSGILICNCCGSRMTRKTIHRKNKDYFYYYCPTGKKNGCTAPIMMKEEKLIQCVQESLKSQIDNVTSLKNILESVDKDHINNEAVKEYSEQIKVNEEHLDRIKKYKSKLYESLINKAIDKEEFMIYKNQYSEDIKCLKNANTELEEKINEIVENRSERNRWIEYFTEFSNMDKLDRKAVMQLIKSIRIIEKNKVEITFNYQSEYQIVMNFINQIKERQAG